MCLVPWLYPPGSGLRFHRDDGSYRGSFTFFLSGEWQLDWGGLLLLASRGSTIEHTQIGWDGASKPLSDSASWGSYVCPRANRLALIGPACGHMITRVDRNAGSRVRASVAGFFLRGSA
jgi:Rps23 Pro-64 3,4-dihydroxylase Tpa1-like proline 4-hydroxylase